MSNSSKPLVPCSTINSSSSSKQSFSNIEILALLDSGASECFIDQNFAAKNNIPLLKLNEKTPLVLIDGSDHRTGPISHVTVPLLVSLGDATHVVSFLVSNFPSCPVILGFPWLKKYNPCVDWQQLTLAFPYPSNENSNNLSIDQNSDPNIKGEVPPTSGQNTVYHAGTALLDSELKENIDKDLELVIMEDLDNSSESCLSNQVPAEYADFADVFSKQNAEILPDERPFDCSIDLIDPAAPLPFKPIYNLSPKELESQRLYIEENLKTGFIRPSKSPIGSPQFFVPKKDGTLRPCVDYRDLNSLTIKDRTPLPLISDLLDRTAGSKLFTKIDLRGAYNLVRIKPGDEWKTAFRTRFGLFEYLVMPFGLTNAPAVFQRMMNTIFSDIMDQFMVVYLDDILVFSPDLDSHIKHVRTVLERLRQYKLFVKGEKCMFHSSSVEFLGFVISEGQIAMDPGKIAAIDTWPKPNRVKDIQSFLGFCNFYRRFIKDFSKIARPLTELTKKDAAFIWTDSCELAFNTLKQAMVENPVLRTVDPTLPFTIQTDASDFALGAVLSQPDPEIKVLHPIAYYSRKLLPAERNYTVHDKELLAIVAAFQNWRHYLAGSPHVIDVFSDHKNLLFFQKSRLLRPRHARWNLILSEFDFRLNFTAGNQNQAADALSRRSDYLEEGDGIESPQQMTLLPENRWHRIAALTVRSDVIDGDIDLDEDWPLVIAHFLVKDAWPDGIPEDVLKKLKSESKHFRILNSNAQELVRETPDGPINYLVSADRLKTVKRFHYTLGHMGADSILPLIRRRFWYPKMSDHVKKVIRECDTCQRNRADSGAAAPAPLRPIPPCGMPFERWGMDFVGPLPESKSGNKYILTAIDYATRWVVCKAYPDKSATSVMHFFYNHIVMEYGPPFEIITDRDKAFLEDALPHYEKLLRIKHLPTTSYHPRTNGMVERMHQMLNHSLRCLTQDHLDRWDEFLAQTVFAIRAREHAVTKFSPFYLMFGVEPRLPIDSTPPTSTMKPLDEIERMEERSEFIARNLDELGLARRAATERSLAQAEAMKLRNSGGIQNELSQKTHKFEIGDWVKLKMKKKSKWERQWSGPFMVVKLSFPHTYYIMTFRGDWINDPVNEERLALWKGNSPDVLNPIENDDLIDYLNNEDPGIEDDS